MTRIAVPPALSEKMREWRRDFHRYPERGWAEFRTTAKIAAELRAFGENYTIAAEHGIPNYMAQ